MSYTDYIVAIQNGIDDANDYIRRINETQEKLDHNPDDVDLQNNIAMLKDELKKSFNDTNYLMKQAAQDYHTDKSGDIEKREQFQRIWDLRPAFRKLESQIKSLGIDLSNSVKVEDPIEDKLEMQTRNLEKNDLEIQNKEPKEDKLEMQNNYSLENDLIPGTNFKKPRVRGLNESNENYIAYLNDYYTSLFQNVKEDDKNNQNDRDDDIKSFQPTSMVPIKEKEKDIKNFQPTSMVPVEDKDIMDKYRKNHKKKKKDDTPQIEDNNKKKKEENIPQIENNTKVESLPSPEKEDEKKKEEPVSSVEDRNVNTRGYLSVIRDLTDGLGISKKSNRYFASEIQVSKTFKNELKTGNWLYNVVGLLPKVTIRAASAFVQKMWGKLTLNAQQKKDMKELVSRVNQMPDSDVEILIDEYTNNRMLQERFPSALNQALVPRIKKYNNDRVGKLNEQITSNYKDLFSTYQEVNALNDIINDPNTTDVDRQSYINEKNRLLQNTIDEIMEVRNNQEKADKILSDGTHGFEEGSKASKTKMSIVGMRFAKDYDLNNELLNEQANLQEGERLACMNNNPEEALKNFIGTEELYAKNTKIDNSIFGKRSTGEKYYSPLAEELDYRDDPFVRDLFSSIAIAGTIISTANAINTHINEANKVLRDQQNEVNRVNSSNNATMDQVHRTGQDIADKRDTFTRGFEAQAKQDVNNYGMTGERKVLDETGGGYGWDISTSTYNAADSMQHAATHTLSDSINSSINNITSQVSSGAISHAQAMQQMRDVVTYSQHELSGLASNYIGTLTQYAQNNPYDLAGVQDALQYIVNNPTSIIDMNQAAIDVTNLGEVLTGLTFEQVKALETLPSDMLTTIIGDVAAISYMAKIEGDMRENCKVGKYGNEVTNLVNEFVNDKENSSKSRSM